MKFVLLGPPGSGKGTVAEKLVRDFNLSHVCPGNILREEISKETEIGNKIKPYMDRGELVPNLFVVELVRLEVDGKDNFVLDGFPRTVDQAESISEIKLDGVIYLDVPLKVVVDRLTKRRLDPKTGKIYHLEYLPPPEEAKARLVQRGDDKPEVVKERFKVYEQQTEPLVAYYHKKNLLKKVKGDNLPEKVYSDVKEMIKIWQES